MNKNALHEVINHQAAEIIALQDLHEKQETLIDKLKAEAEKTQDLYAGAVAWVAAERDVAVQLAEELKRDVQHWQDLQDREHAAFVQAAEERDQALRDKHDLQQRLKAAKAAAAHADKAGDEMAVVVMERDKAVAEMEQMLLDRTKADVFISNLCEMVACDCDLSDIADELTQWRRGEWVETARKLMQKNVSVQIIEECTGLSEEEILKVK